MGITKVCEYCGKEFLTNSELARTCSLNCRVKMSYHKKNPNARRNVTGKTDEKKKQEHNDYNRMYYRNNEKYREEHKARRREYYKMYHR